VFLKFVDKHCRFRYTGMLTGGGKNQAVYGAI